MNHSNVRLPQNFAPKGYEPLELLHEGGYSLVYRALRSADQTAVIIKTTPPQVALRASDHLTFRNQFTIGQNLDHPGVLQILGLEPCNHSYALIMEDVQGIALSQFLQTAISLKDGLTIALQLAEILQYLSQKRILHKDIKPANILIHPQTLQVKLIDFGIASRLPKETQTTKNPKGLEGTLAYMAPEQTGRMNRGIDFRSDFYGLGVTLFQLFSGQLPFQADEPMEWLHCHLAQEPPSLTEFGVPTAVANIVAKLLAKNAEDRYQSALGLKDDLKRCLTQLTEQGAIEPFEVGQNDVCDRFLIPEKLYGRDTDVQTLLNAFDRVAQGASELMLIAGASGIGKTALVNQVHLPIAQQKGFFIRGKFDQFNRNVPFFAWVQALQDLIKQLLSESDSTLVDWKAKILAGVGEQGQVLIEVIPELALILGPQPAVPELSGVAAQNRFNRLFRQLIQVFTAHPLVIFLDDLQWADAASLHLLKQLMTGAERGTLFLLGAYRENEVLPVHPLMLTLDDLQESGKKLQTLHLKPLQPQDVCHLVADSLHCSAANATPLAQLVYQKTQGNPFFTTQFLQGMQADGWMTFNTDARYWECDLSQIRSLALTDDVVEFMVNRLQQLPPQTQNVLAIAACLGNSFKLDTLAVVCEQSPETLAQDLWSALQAGLILPENETYKFFQTFPDQPAPELTTPLEMSVTYRFLHDRGQQAAYALIPTSQKHQTHYRMGQFLLDHLPPDQQEESLFDIVNQLNIGRDLITAADAQHRLISLNLRAGIKAKSATAYGAALDYFEIAINLLSAEGWQQHYPLALTLHDHAAEVAYLIGDLARMDALIQTVAHQAQSCLDTVNTAQVKMQSCLGQNQPLTSIEIACSLLQDLGVALPDSPTLEEVKQELNTFKQLAASFSFEQIVALPTVTDPKELAIISTLMLMISPTMITNPNLFFWIVLVAQKRSLTTGNSPYLAYGYSALAILFQNLEQNIDAAYNWGNLSLRLLSTPHGEILGNRMYQSMSAFILHGKRHVEETLSVLQQAYTSGLDKGDFEFAGYALVVKCYNLYFLGRELSEVQQAIRKANDALSDLGQNLPLSWNQCCDRAITHLSSPEQDADLGAGLDADTYVQAKQAQGDAFGLCYVYLNQAILRYTLGDYSQALAATELVEHYLPGQAGMLSEVVFYFYDSLIRLGCAQGPDDAQGLAKVHDNQQKMKNWADHAPMNFQHKYELVYAEEQRCLGDRLAAMDAYDRAIAGAKEHGYGQEQALANERAAQFYLDWGKEKIAALYMQEAYDGYRRWGAKAKTDRLIQDYAPLLQPILQQNNTIDPLETLDSIAPLHLSIHSTASHSPSAPDPLNAALDLATLFKSAQALSDSLDLNALLEKLAPMMLRASGAERLVLLFPDDDHAWQVRVTATAEATQLVSVSLKDHPHLPFKLIQYVQRTQEILAVDGHDPSLLADPYLQCHPRCSALCLPLLYQSNLNGLLYLEHHSVPGIFSRDRITVLNFLCTQSAIALENALLKQTLEQKLEVQTAKRQASETRLRNMVDNIPGVVYQARVTGENADSLFYISPNCQTLYELSAQTMMQGHCSLRDFEHSEDKAIIDQMLATANQTLQPFNHEFRILTPSGHLKWVQVISRPSRQPDGSTHWDGIVMDISDRKQLEQEQNRLTKILQSTSDFIGICQPEKGILWQNQPFRQLRPDLKITEEQVPISKLYPEWAFEIVKQEGLPAAIEQGIWSGETALLTPSGEEIPTSQVIIAHKSEKGDVEYLSTILRDMSDRKQLEQEQLNLIQALQDTSEENAQLYADSQKQARSLEESRNRLEQIVLQTPAAVVEWNADFEFLTWNPAAEKIFGFRAEEAIGQHFRLIVPPDQQAYVDKVATDLLSQSGGSHAINEIVTKDGKYITCEWFNAPKIDADGQVYGGISIALDISERNAKEQELILTKFALDNAATGILWINSEGQLTRVNESACISLGYGPEELKQLSVWEITPDLQAEDWPDYWASIRHQTYARFETCHQAKDGSIYPVEITCNYLEYNGVGHQFVQVQDIRDRKAAELALEESQDQFRRMTENVPGVIYRYVLHADGSDKFTYLSSQVQELFEITPEIALQKTSAVWDVIHPDDVPRLLEALQKSLETLQPLWSEHRLNLAQKGLRWVQLFAQPERLDNGDVIFDGVVIDITDRKQSEEELRKLSERLELALDSANIGVWEWDYQNSVLTWDERMFTLFGVSPGDFKGTFQDWEQCVHPDDLAHAQEGAFPNQQSVEGNPLSTKEYRVIHPDGSIRHILATAMIQWTPQGQLARAIGVNLDITDRKHAERALQLSEARATAVFDQATVGVVEANLLSGQLTRFNHYFCDLLGYSSGELQHMSLVDLTHPDDVLECKQLIKALATGKISNFALERRFIHKNGSIVWVLASANRVQLANDQPHMGVAILQDISDRKAAELALQDAQAQFRRMTENVPGMIYRWVIRADGSQAFIYVSSKVREFCEFEPDAVLENETLIWQRIHPDDVSQLQNDIAVHTKILQPFTNELRLILPQKGLRWVQLNSQPEPLDNGDVVWDGVMIDISDRKQAEHQLQALSERLELAVESAQLGIWEWDHHENLLAWDDRMFAIYGVSPQAFEGTYQDWANWVHLEDLVQLEAETPDIISSQAKTYTQEFRIIRPNGSIRYILATASIERNSQGQPIRSVGINLDITDRKEAELALQKAQTQFRNMTENVPGMIYRYVLHPDGSEDMTYISAQVREIFEVEPATVLQSTDPLWDRVYPDDVTLVRDAFNLSAETLEPYHTEHRLVLPQKGLRWVQGMARPERLNNGDVIWDGVVIDISDRKQAELALQEAQSQFRRMTENIPGMIFRCVMDPDGIDTVTHISSKVREIYEIDPKAVLADGGRQMWERTHPDDLARVVADIQISAETLQPFKNEQRLILPKKGLRWIQTVAQPERLANGYMAWDGVVIDITDRKMAELSLQQSEEKFRMLVSNLHGAVYRAQHDQDWTINYISDAISDLSGYPASDFIENTVRTYASIIHPDDTDYMDESVAQAIVKRESFVLEYRILHRDGSIRWVSEKGKGIFDQNNLLLNLEGVIFDITDRKQAEAQLQRTNAELIRATHHKSAFLASMSHELRTPLNAVLGFSQLMQRDSSISDDHHEMLATINRNGEYLLALINDILEMSKIEAGKVTLNPKPVDLPRFLDDIRATFKVKAEAKHLVFKVTHTADIPRYIEADEVKLRQILLNLLSNALKFTNEGQISLHTQMLDNSPSPEQVHLQFTVSDTGPGIASEDLDNIFQAFIQSESGKQHQQGTGLGLPISRKFAQMMGGTIQVTSTLEQGSTFNCDIYAQILAEDTEVVEMQPLRYQNIQGVKSQHPSYRLLIVDDNPDNRAVLSKMLSIPGFEVREAVDGSQAVEINGHWQPHLICMDINMPQMDGLEATRQIRQSGSTSKIIAITANAFADDHQAALAAGCDDFLAKPITEEKVFERIACLLEVEFETISMPSSPLQTPPSVSTKDLIKDGFGVMSIEWQQHMHQAIRTLDECSIRQLLADVPEAHAAMVDAISKLLKEYRYDMLMSILEIEP